MNLFDAAEVGDVKCVVQLLSAGGSVDGTDRLGRSALARAASRGHLDVICILVEYGATVDACGRNKWIPLILCASHGYMETVRYLVEHGATMDASDIFGRSALILSARYGHLNVVRYLVEHGAEMDARDCKGRTPLIWAAKDGYLDVVRFLLEGGAAVNAQDNEGLTMLMIAVENGHLDLVRFLVEHGATLNARNNPRKTPLICAAISGRLNVVQLFVEHGADVDASDNGGWTPLMYASELCYFDMVQYLVELGANVNSRDSDGLTPLTLAIKDSNSYKLRILAEHGADVDASDNGGWTPLMYASELCYFDMVQYLVELGVNVNSRDSDGLTPLTLAIKDSNSYKLRILAEHGADVKYNDFKDRTPVTGAACNGRMDTVRYLLEHGADVDVYDSNGWTPLMWAANVGDWEIVRVIVKHGAVVDARDFGGISSLMRAAHDGDWDGVRYLAELGATVDGSCSDGLSPLIKATSDGHWDMVRLLVERGAAVDARNSGGQTALIQAASTGRLDMVRFLVNHGADSNLKTAAGDTALSSATKFGRQGVVQYLLPLARYQDQRPQMQHRDEDERKSSNIPSSWLIPPFEIEVEPFIDAGQIGGDYRGKWLDANVVVKLFIYDGTSATFVDEVRLWHQLRHPNVLKLYGVCDTEHKLFVCEYAGKGSLPEYLKLCDPEYRTPWKFLYEAALGLEYLHERKIIHGKLRGSKILIGSDRLAKLSGFGLNMPSPEKIRNSPGAWVRWAAPESLKGEQVSIASDVYSLGMCISEVVSGKIPFDMDSERNVESTKTMHGKAMICEMCRQVCSSYEQKDLLVAMCRTAPCERLQMPAVVDQLHRFAEVEAVKLTQHTTQPKPEPLMNFDAFDEFNHGRTSSLWTALRTLVAQSENTLYRQTYHDLKLIYDTLRSKSQLESTLERFHSLLVECQRALDELSKQSQVRRLSATRARDHSVQGLHRRITQLLQLVHPQDQDAETRETKWKRLCREQIEIFVSEASEACVMLGSVDSEEDRSALVAVLRAELRNSDGKYTDKQLAVLQKTCDDIVSKSLEDVHLATTPEWFIPWFELEMNEMATLGEGGFGSVIKAKWLDSEVVVKKLEISDKDAANADKKREMRQMFEREVDIWFGLSHPHVVRLFGACHVGRPFFVCELAPNGTLVEYLRRHPDELWTKLREAALGVQYLHARGIVHGDLKGTNIMIGSDGKAKVTDFGLSGVFGDDSTEMMLSGAWHWVAPECLLGEKPTFVSDVYSLGMCIIEALRVTNGVKYTLPWGDLPNLLVKYHATRNTLPLRPGNCSDEAWMLIERMCKSAPADRMLIMTVVDEIEKLAGRHGDLIAETDEMFGDNSEVRRSPLSVANALAEVKNWIAKCDTRSDWEGSVLEKIYQLLWDRLEMVSQLMPDGEDIIGFNAPIIDFSTLVEHSKQRTRDALNVTGAVPLIKFTELALGGYALHRRLDKFMAAHAVPKDSSTLHDWTSACSTFMKVSASPPPVCSDDDCSANEETGSSTKMASSMEVAAAS